MATSEAPAGWLTFLLLCDLNTLQKSEYLDMQASGPQWEKKGVVRNRCSLSKPGRLPPSAQPGPCTSPTLRLPS